MSIPSSTEVERILHQARDLADQSTLHFDTSFLLLAMFTIDNEGLHVLKSMKVHEDRLLDALSELQSDSEEHTVRLEVVRQMQRIASSDKAAVCSPLHLLFALSKVRNSMAYRVLQRAGIEPSDVRVTAASRLSEAVENPITSPGHQVGFLNARAVDLEAAPTETEVRTLTAWSDAEVEAAERELAATLPAPEKGSRDTPFSLDPRECPALDSLGRNLTEEAWLGEIDPVIGRDVEIVQVLDILQKRRSNNPCLLGEPGVGKTAIVEGVARALAGVDEVGAAGGDRILIELNMSALVAGTQLRGAFAERLEAVKREVRNADGRIIIFIDELHTLIGTGAGDGPMDAANDLKAALARGEFPCIGATTLREYSRHIENDAALERRLQPVHVAEPDHERTLEILAGIVERYEDHHDVQVEEGALEAAVRLSARHIQDRKLPDKAINILDLACARVSRLRREVVGVEDVADVVSQQTGIPAEKLSERDTQRLLALEEFLEARVIGQSKPLARIAEVIRRNFAGFNSERPMGSFLMVGPTGVGKTETVKVLAEFLFQSRDAVLRFDMSEFAETHSVSKLIGSPPGYVGHAEGGQLTDAMHKRPYQIVLFDEIEKANPEVWNLLLQVLDEGQLTDSRGRRVSFSETVVMMTSNLGADAFQETSGARPIGFGGAPPPMEEQEGRLLKSVQRDLPAELWNRIEDKLVYCPLQREDVAKIAGILLQSSSDRLMADKDISYEVDEDLIGLLIRNGGYDPALGARPMRQTIQRVVEGAIADEILSGAVRGGDRLHVTCWEDEIDVVVKDGEQS